MVLGRGTGMEPSQFAALEALDAAVYVTDAEGNITFYNDAAADLWGHRPDLNSKKWCGSWKLYWPDGKPMAFDECPMATTLREGRRPQGATAIAERPDGSRVHFRPYPSAIRDDKGKIVGGVNLLVDLHSEDAAAVDLARLAAIIASSDDAIVAKDLNGIVTSWNAAAERIFGYTAAEMIGHSIIRIIPTELRQEEDHILGKLRRGEHIRHFDSVRVRKDGRRIDVSLTISPIRDPAGNIVGASKIARDVTERKAGERLQKLLFQELNHRVKNTLAMVQAMATQSLRSTVDARSFTEAFSGRIQALAKAHDLLVERKLEGADLASLVREQVSLGADRSRIMPSGPDVILPSQIAVEMGLVLHELATNARKYGALAVPDGRVSVTWTIDGKEADQCLSLSWKEYGVQPDPPVDHGFGGRLIERAFSAYGGSTDLRFEPDGVACEITVPLPYATVSTRSYDRQAGYDDRPPIDLAGKRVLVVEDDPIVGMELKSHLTDLGCEIAGPAETIDKAKALAKSEALDAALVDGNLGGRMIDADLLTILEGRKLPFAFSTGYSREALPEKAAERPILRKPFGKDEIRIVLNELLAETGAVSGEVA